MKNFGLALLAYVILASVLTWPVIGYLTTRVVGEGGDPWQSLWRLQTTQTALTTAWHNGQLGQLLAHEFLGQGEARLVNLSAWPWLWLQILLGAVTTYNLIWLLSYILAGVSVYALVSWVLRQFSENKQRPIVFPSFLAGLLYMLLPYHVAHSLGHFGALQVEWIPLAILAWLMWLKQPTWWRTLVVAVLLSLQAWTEHHYVLWLAIAFVWLAWCVRGWWATTVKKYLPPLIVLVALLILGVVLPYLPTIHQATAPDSILDLGEQQTIRFSADALAPIIPPATHTVWGKLFGPIYDSGLTGNASESTQYLGIIPLLLVIFFYSSIPRGQRQLWTGLTVIFLVLSWGPWLHILGWVTKVPLPYWLLQHLPIFSAIRTVARAGIMVGLSVSVLLAWVLHTQVSRLKMYGLLAALLILEFISVPFPMQSAQLNPVYSWVKSLPGTAVIEVPAATNYVTASQALYAETIHGKTTLGNIALERAQAADELDYVQSLPGIRQLLYVRTTDIRQDRREFFGQDIVETLPDVLRWMKVSAVLLDTDSLSILQLKSLQQLLTDIHVAPQPFADVQAYDTSHVSNPTDGVFVRRGAGWTGVGFDKATGHTLAQIEKTVTIGVINVTSDTKPVTLQFLIKQPTGAALTVMMDNQPVTTMTMADSQLRVQLVVPPGEHTITWTNQQAEPVVIQDPQMIVGSH